MKMIQVLKEFRHMGAKPLELLKEVLKLTNQAYLNEWYNTVGGK